MSIRDKYIEIIVGYMEIRDRLIDRYMGRLFMVSSCVGNPMYANGDGGGGQQQKNILRLKKHRCKFNIRKI